MNAIQSTPEDLRDFGDTIQRLLARMADGPIAFENDLASIEPTLWERAVSLGWTGLALDSSRGGSGGGLGELAMLHHVLGRWVPPGPYLGTSLAACLLEPTTLPPADVQSVMTRGVALAVPIADQASNAPAFRVVRTSGHEAWILAIDDRSATLISGVPGSWPGEHTFDPGVGSVIAQLDLSEGVILDHVAARRTLAVLIGAACTGISERMLAVAVDHAKQRHQFGQPIGAFQAVKHRTADMAIKHRALYATVLYTVDAVTFERHDVDRAADAAARLGVATALENAEACLETHGAMGHTWEFAGHRFLKRAHVLRGLVDSVLTISSQESNP